MPMSAHGFWTGNGAVSNTGQNCCRLATPHSEVDELPGGMTTARSPKPAVNGGPYHQAPSFAVARSAKSRKPRAPKKVKQKA